MELQEIREDSDLSTSDDNNEEYSGFSLDESIDFSKVNNEWEDVVTRFFLNEIWIEKIRNILSYNAFSQKIEDELSKTIDHKARIKKALDLYHINNSHRLDIQNNTQSIDPALSELIEKKKQWIKNKQSDEQCIETWEENQKLRENKDIDELDKDIDELDKFWEKLIEQLQIEKTKRTKLARHKKKIRNFKQIFNKELFLKSFLWWISNHYKKNFQDLYTSSENEAGKKEIYFSLDVLEEKQNKSEELNLSSKENKPVTRTKIITISTVFAILLSLNSWEIKNDIEPIDREAHEFIDKKKKKEKIQQYSLNEQNKKQEIIDQSRLVLNNMMNSHYTIDAAVLSFGYKLRNIVDQVLWYSNAHKDFSVNFWYNKDSIYITIDRKLDNTSYASWAINIDHNTSPQEDIFHEQLQNNVQTFMQDIVNLRWIESQLSALILKLLSSSFQNTYDDKIKIEYYSSGDYLFINIGKWVNHKAMIAQIKIPAHLK